MYNVKLDSTNHYTGSYALIGKIDGGIDLETLPPEENSVKALCYKYEAHDVITIQIVPILEIDVETEESVQMVDENGIPMTKEQLITTSVTEWFLDEAKWAECVSNLLVEQKKAKLEEINNTCQSTILAGINVALDEETTNHFKFTLEDQSNIKALYDNVKSGALFVPYHVDGEMCRLFTADEVIKLYTAMEAFKTYNLTLCSYIKAYVKTLTTESDINAVNYDVNTMSEEYRNLFNAFITSITI